MERTPRRFAPVRARNWLTFAIVFAGTFGFLRGRQAESQPIPYHPELVAVAFHEQSGLAARHNLCLRYGLKPDLAARSPYFTALRITPQARAAGTTVSTLVAALRREPSVRIAEPVYFYSAAAIPNDPRFNELWGLQNQGQTGGTPGADISAVEAWDLNVGNDTVIVGVIDSGIDYDHPDLRDNILRDPRGRVVGFDFADGDSDPMDDNSHGTHVAGTVGARGNNAVGITGVCQRVKLMPIRVLDTLGVGTSIGIAQGIDFATLNGADITNNSYGGPAFSQIELEAIQRANAAGVLFVAAAGNGGSDGIGDDNDALPHYPSSYDVPNVVAVAATDHNDELADFSNFGVESVDLGAPGVGILSTIPNGSYDLMSGTSMATPHVAGAYALIKAHAPQLTMIQLRDTLLNAVDPVQDLDGRCVTGGRLNLLAALESVTNFNEGPTAEVAAEFIDAVELEEVTLDASPSTDPEDDPLLFQWRQIAGPPVTLGDADTEIAHFTAPLVRQDPLTLLFEVSVSDGQLTDTATVEVTVDVAPPGLVLGQVTDAQDQPIAGATVRAVRSDGAEGEEVLTDPSGGYVLAARAGTNTVIASTEELEPAQATTQVASGGLSVVDLQLTRSAARLVGTIRSAAGRPIDGALVEVLDSSGETLRSTTSQDGQYVLPGINQLLVRQGRFVRVSGEDVMDWVVNLPLIRPVQDNRLDFLYGDLTLRIAPVKTKGAKRGPQTKIRGPFTVELLHGGQVLESGTTSRKGQITFTNVAATIFQVRIRGNGLRTNQSQVTAQPGRRVRATIFVVP